MTENVISLNAPGTGNTGDGNRPEPDRGWALMEQGVVGLVIIVVIVSVHPVVLLVHGAAMVLIFMVLLRLLMRNKYRDTYQCLGTGDRWMIVGMTAWLDLPDMAMALITAFAGFVAWHLTVGTGMRSGGPLGPWLSAGCVLILIQRLYQPLWVV